MEAAHAAYAADRAGDLAAAGEWGGVAGTRVGIKCLHAHYAYRLAGGDDPAGAWIAERIEPVHAGQRAGRVAAIDQGTNSIRLLVVEPGATPDAAATELARDMVITRLGRDVDRTGRLGDEALARTVDVLARFTPPGPGARGRAHPGGSDERRARRGEPRRLRGRRARARRVGARGHHRRAGSRPVLPRGHPRARPVVGSVRGAGHRRRVDGVRHRCGAGPRGASLARPAWAACA